MQKACVQFLNCGRVYYGKAFNRRIEAQSRILIVLNMMRNWRVSLNKSEKSMKMKEKYVTFECCCWRTAIK